MVIGSPNTVKQRLLELTDRYETNEIMVLCNVFDFEAKKNLMNVLLNCFYKKQFSLGKTAFHVTGALFTLGFFLINIQTP